MQLSEKPKIFSRFFIAFLESALNLEHIEKKMSLIAQVFRKLLTPKDGSERVKVTALYRSLISQFNRY